MWPAPKGLILDSICFVLLVNCLHRDFFTYLIQGYLIFHTLGSFFPQNLNICLDHTEDFWFKKYSVAVFSTNLN